MTSEHSGNKYNRKVYSVTQPAAWVDCDVYAILKAFAVTCPARQHAIKKLLCAGIRGKGGEFQDLIEARDAISRAIEMQQDG